MKTLDWIEYLLSGHRELTPEEAANLTSYYAKADWAVSEIKNDALFTIGPDPDNGSASITVGDLNLYQLLVRARGLISAYVPMHQADATLDDLTMVIDALDAFKGGKSWQDPR